MLTQKEKRIKIAQSDGISICPNCLNAIDPDICGCGEEIKSANHDNHSPIPQGCRCFYEDRLQEEWLGVPDYFNDILACCELEESHRDLNWPSFIYNLAEIVGAQVNPDEGDIDTGDFWKVLHATAAERAEAIGQTLKLW